MSRREPITKNGTGRFAIVVLDGVGIGETPDQDRYGDRGSNTLGNVARAVGGLRLPYLESLGLGCCRPVQGIACGEAKAAHGIAYSSSAGKDSTTGHWEICEVVLEKPFPTYPQGFPAGVIEEFERRTGRGVLGNKPASGTAIIDEYGTEHLRTGKWIVYTSADSVFQVAAHEEKVSLEELNWACQTARQILRGPRAVSRVIARPFLGQPGHFTRTRNRRDFSVDPVRATLLDRLADAGVVRVGVGKVDDLFAHRSIRSRHAPTNGDAYRLMEEELARMDGGLLFVNVIEFDQSWGHRNDVSGFYEGLKELDAVLPGLVNRLRLGDIMILTADHGTDPTTPSTDHSREAVPILGVGPGVAPVDLGTRTTFADIGATAAEYFGLAPMVGTSFLREMLPHGFGPEDLGR